MHKAIGKKHQVVLEATTVTLFHPNLCRRRRQFYTLSLFEGSGGNSESWEGFFYLLSNFYLLILPHLYFDLTILIDSSRSIEEAPDERVPLVLYRFSRFDKMIPLIELLIQFCCTKNLLYIYIYIYIYILFQEK